MSHDLRADVLRDALAATVWREVAVHDEVGSTNDLLLADPRPWRVVTADHQSSGRGRLDRSWEAPPGTSIALSCTLPLPADQARWGWVPLLVGVAVRRAVAELTGVQLALKWPNDLLALTSEDAEWRKVAGILCTVAGGEAPVVVVGIGLNVHQSADQLPTDVSTSLRECGADVAREDLIECILRELLLIQRQWATSATDDDYRAACITVGQRVRLQTGAERHLTGDAVGVDAAGRLLITAQGQTTAYAAGDVVHVRPTDDAPSSEPEPPAVLSPAGELDPAEFVDAIEARLMGHPRSMRRSEISRASGISQDQTATMWRSLGFARARDDEVFFGEADLEALRRFDGLVQDGLLDRTTGLALARAVGRSTDRMAMWSLQLIADMVSGDRGGVDSDVAQRTAALTVELAERMSPLVDYVWRRNLSVAISRMIADSEPESHIGIVRTVGFADLVNFTQLVRRLSERELAQLVLRFESLASDIVGAHGGAIVKTVGDEVLFTHTAVEGAVDIAFDLRAAAEADDLVPTMRVGMARGRVLARLGDVYGTTVNRASRLTGAAKPGKIMVDQEVMDGLPDGAAVRVRRRKRVDLAGIGATDAFVIERPSQ
ncbi:biotin--[acetyl-CoA-carboxylase] ligase [Allobranchiibius huperziae]|uniref:biotin--[biotin carboxyl-carrier protein] ligase n=1 Tax=Allobranchiibius huperziae TaxID=1874116 RepID=A0A853DD46_9MICO|nr:biotin-[acetyl-CoA-carboxylase] ligase BirA-like protein [Allobranchiibius huperziae]